MQPVTGSCCQAHPTFQTSCQCCIVGGISFAHKMVGSRFTYPFLAVSRTRVGNVVPDQWSACARKDSPARSLPVCPMVRLGRSLTSAPNLGISCRSSRRALPRFNGHHAFSHRSLSRLIFSLSCSDFPLSTTRASFSLDARWAAASRSMNIASASERQIVRTVWNNITARQVVSQ